MRLRRTVLGVAAASLLPTFAFPPALALTPDDARLELDRRDILTRRLPARFGGSRVSVRPDPTLTRRSTAELVELYNTALGFTEPWELVPVGDAPEPGLADRSGSICAVVYAEDLETVDGVPRLRVHTTELLNVAGEEGPTVVGEIVCTGFLVSPSVVATAGHVIPVSCTATDFRFVFGLEQLQDDGDGWCNLAPHQVYTGACLRGLAMGAHDWALVALDETVRGADGLVAEPLPLAATAETDWKVFVVGHPFGLPLRSAGPGVIEDVSLGIALRTSLCSYPVGSGSPILHLRADGAFEVVGVHTGASHCLPVYDDEGHPIGCTVPACATCCESAESRVRGIGDVLGMIELSTDANSSVAVVRVQGETFFLAPGTRSVKLRVAAAGATIEVLTGDESDAPSRWQRLQVVPGSRYAIREQGLGLAHGKGTGIFRLEPDSR
jgi:hypothetical protein